MFTATVYSGARILRQLALVDAHLATSQKVVELTLQREATARQQEIIRIAAPETIVPPANILDSLASIGNYTTVFDVTFGHKDSFKHPSDPPVLENKVSFPLGGHVPSFNLDAYLKEGTVPLGGLAYPRYKVASVSFAASDVELHCLHSDMHFGPRQSHKDRFRRGSWLREGTEEPVFFSEGCSCPRLVIE